MFCGESDEICRANVLGARNAEPAVAQATPAGQFFG
tara:strand:+ start:350 stop:457 length:108 start_codon:yes stop_codon:yes gene_type:complete